MSKFGITERGDAGRDLSWIAKMGTVDMAVLITKTPTDEFIEEVKAFKDKMIIHLTCTGWGGTKVEPNVFPPERIVGAARALLASGFTMDQIVLRLDPIILYEKWTGERERAVLEAFKGLVSRVRFSFMDMYPHVAERFKAVYNWVPYTSFYAPREWMMRAFRMMKEFHMDYVFEACAESVPPGDDWHDFMIQQGCVSEMDADALGMTGLDFTGSKGQRKGCLCPAGKVELLNWQKCSNGCIYCYWKHN